MAMRAGARRAGLAALALVSAADVALAADDSGVHAFLSNMFGEAGQTAASPARPVARDSGRRERVAHRALTIRPTTILAVGPTKPEAVSIYRDPTLRPGDAVMTAEGIRIFEGSRSWPYAKSDFVALAKARDLSRDTVKVLVALNNLPRG